MVQMLAGLITYILLAIYCHDEYQEHVSVKRLREICIKIRNETSLADIVNDTGIMDISAPRLREFICNYLTGHCWREYL